MSNEQKMIEQTDDAEADEFLEKFGYREYTGGRNNQFFRILNGIWFEVKSTWERSTFGKVLLILVILLNAITIIFAASFSPANAEPETIRNSLHRLVANYMTFSGSPVQPGVTSPSLDFSINIGFLLIALFGIAGSGLFADDKQGKVTEIYLSRTNRTTYLTMKIGSIVVYTNLFLMVPLLLTGYLSAQSYGVNHFDYLRFYLGVILYSISTAFVLGMVILVFSIFVEKRNYASLGFFLTFILGSVFGSLIYSLDTSNELLLLASPEVFLQLLAYVCMGDMNLGLGYAGFFDPNARNDPLVLNDGSGLEYFHVLGVAGLYILVFGLLLVYKAYKMTTEEL